MVLDVVVFGGSGFIGSAVANYLSDAGLKVRVADVVRPRDDLGVEFVECDVRDRDSVLRALGDARVAVNTAIVQIPRINEEPRLGYEVNVIGAQNICEAVARSGSCLGMVQAGTWHTIGETGLSGVVDEEFGYRPDKVEERARVYALSKVCQESVVRLFSHMFREKAYVVIRTGTVLGPNMPEQTAAKIFIKNAVGGKPLTPYRHSMYRPILYVDVGDVAKAYEVVVKKILDGDMRGVNNVFNLVYPEPMTVIELAETVKKAVEELTGGKIRPAVEVVDKGIPPLFTPDDKNRFVCKIDRITAILGINRLKDPKASIKELTARALSNQLDQQNLRA